MHGALSNVELTGQTLEHGIMSHTGKTNLAFAV